MIFAIISSDTLAAIGLRHILQSCFEAEATIYASPQEFLESRPERHDGYFVSAEMYVRCMDFLLPRKMRVVLLTDGSAADESELPMLCVRAAEDVLIEAADRCVRLIGRNNEVPLVRDELTPRETDVLRCIAKGLLNKEIADELHISINTVLTHRKNLTAKLGIKTVSGLSLYAMMNGLVASCE